jgi:hypothetical protein
MAEVVARPDHHPDALPVAFYRAPPRTATPGAAAAAAAVYSAAARSAGVSVVAAKRLTVATNGAEEET